MKIIFSSNVAWSIFNFRKDLLQSLQKDGHEIHCVSNDEDGYSSKLKDLDFKFHKVNIKNNSKNPIKDIFLIREYFKIYKSIKPDIILHNAIKPNIYGTIVAGVLSFKTINNISGLGTLFIKKSLSTYLAKFLYFISQKFATIVFFQNKHDMKLFIDSNLVSKNKCKLINGSGVDTTRFIPNNNIIKSNEFHFLFVGRMLKDKGIVELFEAAKQINSEGYKFRLTFLGDLYKDNETSISEDVLKKWQKESFIQYLGATDDVISAMQTADCLVLPSYREGLSKVLIEASSIGIPIITSDVPGCKDVVIDNTNGFLCKVKSSTDLAKQMKKMLELDNKARIKMGENNRKRAKDIFDVNIINKVYRDEIFKILKERNV